MADKRLKYREMAKAVRRFGVGEDAARGKGSHRMLFKVIDGRMVKFPVPCHNEGYELSAAIVRAIRRRFRLTAKDGISDVDFYT